MDVPRRALAPRLVAAVLVLAGTGLGAAACGDDAAPASTDGLPTGTAPPVVDAAPPEALAAEPPPPATGEAVLALGGDDPLPLEVTACAVDDRVPGGPEPLAQVAATAEGVDADGRPVVVEVRRFAQQAAALTITDTVDVVVGDPDDPDRALRAQRFELDGVVSDGRDPSATSPLLRVGRDGAVSARGVFAPPGAFAADGGLVEGAVVLACP